MLALPPCLCRARDWATLRTLMTVLGLTIPAWRNADGGRGELTTTVEVVALVAYSADTVMPALTIAAAEANKVYGPDLNFTLRMYGNRNPGDFGDAMQLNISNFLADYYYHQRHSTESYTIFLPTEWNLPLIASAGQFSRLRDKKRFPTLDCLLPSVLTEHTKVFLALMQRYKWHTVTFICDPASSQDNIFRDACKEFPAVLNSLGNATYQVYDFGTKLAQEDSRMQALLRAKQQSRVIVILAHMNLVRLTMVAKTAFESILVITLSQPQRTPRLLNFFEEIGHLSAQMPKDLTQAGYPMVGEETLVYAKFAFDAFHTIAMTANETVKRGGDLSDGRTFAHSLYNRIFPSIDGTVFNVNNNGDRDSIYTVVGMTSDQGKMEQVLMYNAWDGVLRAPTTGCEWIRSRSPPVDKPSCGSYKDEDRCHAETEDILRTACAGVITVFFLLCIGLVSARVAHRHRIIHDGWWVLDPTRVVLKETEKAKMPRKSNNIVDRKITLYVTKKMVEDEPDRYIAVADFVEYVKGLILLYGPECVLNADQSGFEYEIHSGRTLRTRGLKKKRACVHSITKMTHSYTIVVTIDANGMLLNSLFIALQEIIGNSFVPQVKQGLFTAPNIHVTASEIEKANNWTPPSKSLAYCEKTPTMSAKRANMPRRNLKIFLRDWFGVD
ncbi:hypothetical protein BV898_02816 [Hypsibius exemplaris]|uniref:Receptor ligand binding region domain-containing protein n=1 Tax=Hypsibius exemplaris TaxID=2072580 RepID=A0A1W0X7L4_HYPEX|nr:hypothetical protein BV898_02816 [Hypsibius exemplaris]